VKTEVDCEAGSCGVRRSEQERSSGGGEMVSVTVMSRRALSYSIDNLLATTPTPCRDTDNRHGSAASLRLHSISQQRM